MKRPTRPFVVEIKQSRHGSNKPAAKPLWSGTDLLMLKEAQPEPQDDAPVVSAPVQSRAPVAPPARILLPSVVSPPVEEPTAAAPPPPARVEPTKPRRPAPAPRRVAAPAVAPVVAVAPLAPPTAPVRLRDRTLEELPRGERWKRRLPKVLW